MPLRRLKTVQRRGDWRDTPLLYDMETFQRYPKADGRFTLALYSEDDCGPPYASSWRGGDDYGWRHGNRHRPTLVIDSQSGTGFLTPTADPKYLGCTIAMPQVMMYLIPEGIYRVSIVFAGMDGAVTEVLSDRVAFKGPTLSSPPPQRPLTADLGLPVDVVGAVNSAVLIYPGGIAVPVTAPGATGGLPTAGTGSGATPGTGGGTGTSPGTGTGSNPVIGSLDFSDPANSGLHPAL